MWAAITPGAGSCPFRVEDFVSNVEDATEIIAFALIFFSRH